MNFNYYRRSRIIRTHAIGKLLRSVSDETVDRPQVQVSEFVSEGYDKEVVANKPEINLRTVEQHLNEAHEYIKMSLC